MRYGPKGRVLVSSWIGSPTLREQLLKGGNMSLSGEMDVSVCSLSAEFWGDRQVRTVSMFAPVLLSPLTQAQLGNRARLSRDLPSS